MTDEPAPARPPLERLEGSRVARVDGPDARTVLAVTLEAGRARECLLLVADGPGRGAALVPERPRGESASAFVRRLRKELAGARVEGVHRFDRAVHVALRRGDVRRALVVDTRPPGGALLLLDGDGRALGAPSGAMWRALGLRPGATWAAEGPPAPLDAAALRRLGEGLVGERAERREDAAARALVRHLGRAIARLARTQEAVARDAARAAQSEALRRDAALLVSGDPSADPAGGAVWVWDYTLEPPQRVRVALEPGLDARVQAEAWFRRARRYERGAELARGRIEALTREREALEAIVARVGAGEALGVLEEEARALGVTGAPASRRAAKEPTRLPYRRFVGQGEREIRVGRGARDNDALTLRHARPFDLWLHARGVRGAHVIVPLERNTPCPADLLVDAATLAAHFSEAKGEDTVEVQYAPRRHVRKPKGFPPGAVAVDREKTIVLRLEPARLRGLLAREKPPDP